MPDNFQIKDKDLMGRIGVLETKSGKIETPIFLPVIDPYEQIGENPIISPRDIEAMGFKAVITNAYLIKKRFGGDAAEKGLRSLMGFSGVIMTDSGAYQYMLYGRVDVSNREIVEYQDRIGSDIAVILDIPTREDTSYEEALYSVEETLRRAREVLDIISSSKTIWVLPIQGGGYIDLVRRSAREASQIDGYSAYGIGSPVTFLQSYRYSKVVEMIITAKEEIDPSMPTHLFGAGHPMFIPFAIALGVDMFDSASYILYAKDNRYITEYGTERLEELEVFPCNCPICSKYNPRDLIEMPQRERIRMLAMHNLYAIDREVKRVKTYIREGRLWDLLVERSHSHSSLVDAMRRIERYAEQIEQYTPYSKGRRGLFIYGSRSMAKPQIIRTRRKLERYLEYLVDREARQGRIFALIPGDSSSKPFSSSKAYAEAMERLAVERDLEEVYIVFYTPYLGLVPEDLEDTYPFSQHEAPNEYEGEELDRLAKEIWRFIRRVRGRGADAIFISSDSAPWSKEVGKILDLLEGLGV
ncbi:MAG: tRNA guanosine(15) transglycosylase TgtA [Sulfolobales archaeon]